MDQQINRSISYLTDGSGVLDIGFRSGNYFKQKSALWSSATVLKYTHACFTYGCILCNIYPKHLNDCCFRGPFDVFDGKPHSIRRCDIQFLKPFFPLTLADKALMENITLSKWLAR